MLKLPVNRIHQTHVEHLVRFGYSIVDNVLGDENARSLVKEMQSLHKAGIMFKNTTKLVQPDNTVDLLEKGNIWEQEMFDERIQKMVPKCDQMYRDTSWLRDPLNSLSRNFQLVKQDMKLQVNAGNGGCFPIHCDTDGKVDQRLITAIVYLNENWEDGDGGELKLYPFPYSPVEIRPLFDRMVLFSSVNMLHRVLPSTKPRYCFTIWLSGKSEKGEEEYDANDIDAELASRPELRTLLAKVLYAREWADSIEESHLKDDESVPKTVQKHWDDVGKIVQGLYRYIPHISQHYPISEDANIKVKWF
jgi:hypothetical protein